MGKQLLKKKVKHMRNRTLNYKDYMDIHTDIFNKALENCNDRFNNAVLNFNTAFYKYKFIIHIKSNTIGIPISEINKILIKEKKEAEVLYTSAMASLSYVIATMDYALEIDNNKYIYEAAAKAAANA